jgi:hypothetical protein
MYFKILGSVIIGLMFLTGCGKKSDDTQKDQKAEQEQAAPSGQQQIQGQMNQGNIEVSDAEVKKFVDAVRKVQSINRGAQQEMSKAVQDEGMDVKRFQEIQKSQQSQQQGQANATEAEMKKYRNIMTKMKEVQSGMQQDMSKAIKDAGLTMQKYQQIAKAARNDSTLMKRIQNEMRSSMQKQAQ